MRQFEMEEDYTRGHPDESPRCECQMSVTEGPSALGLGTSGEESLLHAKRQEANPVSAKTNKCLCHEEAGKDCYC